MKKNEDSLRDLQENFKDINICIIRVPERGGREIGPEKLLKEILAKKILLNMGKEAVTQVQETPSGRRYTYIYIYKVKVKMKSLSRV